MNSSTSSFGLKGILDKMKELGDKMSRTPTAFVMTNDMWSKIKGLAPSQPAGADDIGSAFSALIGGVPVETYATTKECLDRMMDQQPGERLQLVSDESIYSEYHDHPYVVENARKLIDQIIKSNSDALWEIEREQFSDESRPIKFVPKF